MWYGMQWHMVENAFAMRGALPYLLALLAGMNLLLGAPVLVMRSPAVLERAMPHLAVHTLISLRLPAHACVAGAVSCWA